MMNLEKITYLKDVPFHDAKIGLIKIDYDKRRIVIEFILSEGKEKIPIKMKFDGFIFFDISDFAPWGESYYVYEVKELKKSDLFRSLEGFNEKKGDFKHYQFLLNSGDTIDILAKSFKIICKNN